jgi:hypothetical protein
MLKGGSHQISFETLQDGVNHLLGNLDGFDANFLKEMTLDRHSIRVEEFVKGPDGGKVVDYRTNEAVTRTVYVQVAPHPDRRLEARVPDSFAPKDAPKELWNTDSGHPKWVVRA